MSLINDALKRASQTTTGTPPVPPSAPKQADPAFQPVEYKKAAPAWPILVFPALLLLGLAVGGWYFFRGSTNSGSPDSGAESSRVQARQPEATPAPEPAPVAQKAAANPQELQALPKAASTPTTIATTTEVTAPAASAPGTVAPVVPAAPTYKLQGIFYRPAHPLAMINGRNVGPGDKVTDATVVSIQRDSVTLSVDGQTKVLTLSQNN